jgi:hypothetical protein
MLLDATIYGLDYGSPMSASPFDYLFHMVVGYLLLFFEPLALIMFMDAAVLWNLDVSLSEQETSAMFIMFMDAAVGWFSMSASLYNKHVLHIYF